VKCSCPVFHREKRGFVNSNANILQSSWWKFLKFLLHLHKPVYYKILRLHVSKNVFFLKFGTYTRNGILELFRWKHSQKPLEVNLLLSTTKSMFGSLWAPLNFEAVDLCFVFIWKPTNKMEFHCKGEIQ